MALKVKVNASEIISSKFLLLISAAMPMPFVTTSVTCMHIEKTSMLQFCHVTIVWASHTIARSPLSKNVTSLVTKHQSITFNIRQNNKKCTSINWLQHLYSISVKHNNSPYGSNVPTDK